MVQSFASITQATTFGCICARSQRIRIIRSWYIITEAIIFQLIVIKTNNKNAETKNNWWKMYTFLANMRNDENWKRAHDTHSQFMFNAILRCSHWMSKFLVVFDFLWSVYDILLLLLLGCIILFFFQVLYVYLEWMLYKKKNIAHLSTAKWTIRMSNTENWNWIFMWMQLKYAQGHYSFQIHFG